ncbi:MAG: hypothetical protein IPK13_09780 [Deltaproteobacteria bacterium]|nr:hypothetical protein [Deltaproteobacteria bacterium]
MRDPPVPVPISDEELQSLMEREDVARILEAYQAGSPVLIIGGSTLLLVIVAVLLVLFLLK